MADLEKGLLNPHRTPHRRLSERLPKNYPTEKQAPHNATWGRFYCKHIMHKRNGYSLRIFCNFRHLIIK
ncbi:MAG: hypothetical protein K2L10_04310 [Ruminococcus sp.]|nr:hypothetical protein [Ruminococcus sp.]